MNRWQRYWFAPGGRRGAAVVRVAIACSILWTLWRLQGGYVADPDAAPSLLYRPVGVLMLLGSAPPPPWLLSLLGWGAWAATAAMLVGWRTRAATVVSWVCAVALASYASSFAATWSHHNNVPFLAQLAFFGARGGDIWSVDAWLRKRRGLPELDVAAGYQWSLRLVQLAVALMFFSAFLAKMFFGGFTPAWALSDNLRHQILSRFDWIGVPRTAVADWLLGEVWRYRAAAVGNLLAQLLPVSSVLLVKRPGLRALAGSVFVIETLALGVVMDLWNVHWLPLVAVFLDWDRLWQWAQERRGRGVEAAAPTPGDGAPGASRLPPGARWSSAFIALFLLYDLVVIAGLDQRLRTYPFTAYPMFGYVRAKRPYGQHQSYEMPGTAIEIVARQPVPAEAQAWIDRSHSFRQIYKLRSVERVRDSLAAMVAQLQRRYPDLAIEGVRVSFAAFQAPAVPAPAELRRVPLGLLGELRDGQLRTALGKVRERGGELFITPRWTGAWDSAPSSPRTGTASSSEMSSASGTDSGAGSGSAAGSDSGSGSGSGWGGGSSSASPSSSPSSPSSSASPWASSSPHGVRYEVVIDYAPERLPLELLPSSGEELRVRRPPGGSILVLAVVGRERYVVGEVGRRRW